MIEKITDGEERNKMSNIMYDESITIDSTKTNRKTVDTSRNDYDNQDMVDKVDAVANMIMEGKKSKYRDVFFPELINSLDLKMGVEIGVDEAGFSSHILTKTKIEKYYCVDNWMDGFGSNGNMRKSKFDTRGDVRYNNAVALLSQFGDRAIPLRMSSMEAVKNFNDNSLDFVYIDGDHSLGMLLDLYAWIPKMRIGGIFSGHDYKIGKNSGIRDFQGEQLDYEVKTCVDYYCKRYGYKLNTVGGLTLSWWFVKNK
ncbi:class I SAM-dependent methyltransferase [bacterium]|nr:MAG: class I SAM-dependent methyltransferase [bacterium]